MNEEKLKTFRYIYQLVLVNEFDIKARTKEEADAKWQDMLAEGINTSDLEYDDSFEKFVGEVKDHE